MNNYVHLNGRLGAEPTIKELENGNKLAKFSLAINTAKTNANGEKDFNTQWHTIVAWGDLAALAERLLHKGTQVKIDGKILNRSYTNKKGETKTYSEIVASDLFIPVKQSS
ncbi:MAG: single-stranded DNA-binding protein [Bacteroidetes bacterium]|nr:single-stranded DNA-binding protein [Bacteroidota bacterium]